MPRVARHVFPNIPHHITQRGNRREDVFFHGDDKQFYLEMLTDYCDKHMIKHDQGVRYVDSFFHRMVEIEKVRIIKKSSWLTP